MNAIYYDNTKLSLDSWIASLRNSEVHKYKFIGSNKAYHTINNKTYLKEYLDGTVLTYELETAK